MAANADLETPIQPTAELQSEIELRAYRLWEERGCPIGSPEEDWFRAETEIRNVLYVTKTAGGARRKLRAA